MRCKIVVLGITGSVGTSAEKIISAFPEKFELIGCSAGDNISGLNAIISKHRSSLQAVSVKEKDKESEVEFDKTSIFSGEEGLLKLLNLHPDKIVMAIAGNAGWKTTVEAVKMGIPVCLANKESVVIAGCLLGKNITSDRNKIIPVDSEHAALMQIIGENDIENSLKVYLTASGGAFRDISLEEMLNSDVQAALNHPVWNMGAKVTIDSATMLNKGLELIEAYWLFGIQPEKLDVLIHPEVDVHAIILFKDGSSKAQVAPSSMLGPVAAALAYPEMLPLTENIPDVLFSYSGKKMSFYSPDLKKYPLLKIAFDLIKHEDYSGMIAYAVSDEIAVDKFIKKEIKIRGIHEIVSKSVEKFSGINSPTYIYEIEELIRKIEKYSKTLL